MEPTAFFCRAKPQGADAFSLFRHAGMVFIGYPLILDPSAYDPGRIASCVVAPDCDQWEWSAAIKKVRAQGASTQQYSQNRNLVMEVGEGSIVVIPRPLEGVAHVARITGPFRVVDDPPWAQRYLRLRHEQGLDTCDEENQHIADVAQGWPVDDFVPIPLTDLPGWIRTSLFKRTTYGWLYPHPVDAGQTAWGYLDRLLRDGQPPPREWTRDTTEIERRLADDLQPATFEHLVVSLLQIEHPHERWIQVGGTGDGGVDGIARNETGDVVALLQCKTNAYAVPEDVGTQRARSGIRRYAAALYVEPPAEEREGVTYLGRRWMAQALARQWRYVPQALSMRVGDGDAVSQSGSAPGGPQFGEPWAE